MIHNIYENLQWKKTLKGTFLSLYASQKNLYFDTPPILLIGGVHGDEPEGVYLAESLLEHFQFLSQKNHKFKQNWLLIPCLNPDGYNNKTRTNSSGVDLNRNFPSSDWSPHFEKERYNPGPYAASELETQAAIELIEKYKPGLIVHFHSWKPSIIFTGDSAKATAEIFSKNSNYVLQHDIGYPTPGSLGQYGFFEKKIGVICIEESEGQLKEQIWNRFKTSFESLF